jgi:hypothetical protein
LAPIQPGDDFAGREAPLLVGVSPEPGGLGYYCQRHEILAIAENPQMDGITREQAQGLLAYWAGRTTQAHCRAAFPAHLAQGLPDDDYVNGLKFLSRFTASPGLIWIMTGSCGWACPVCARPLWNGRQTSNRAFSIR